MPTLILDTVTRGTFPIALVFSLYLLFAGHNAPGGGFVGGLVAGAALVLRYAGRGTAGGLQSAVLRPEVLLGAGMLLAGGTGAAAWLLGRPFLTSGKIELDVPLLGHVKATSALPFDAGVYLVVVGLIAAVLLSLGSEDVKHDEDEAGA
jgi:multicomponent Na+:H+ antiporter subunit A